MKTVTKKMTAFLTAAVMLLAMLPVIVLPVAAENYSGTCGADGDNLTWSLDTETGVLTIDGEGDMKDYYDWDRSPWDSHYSIIRTVQISDGVTSISKWAFYVCRDLISVTIPDSVTSIGEQAFDWCRSLASVTIPSSVTSIGKWAFRDTAYYDNEDNWQDGVLYIGNHLIVAKENIIGDYTVKSGTKTIADYAFSECSSLTSVTIPDSVTGIGSGAFSECSSLTSVTIGNGVTSIGKEAFYDCNGLKEVHISDLLAWCNLSFDHFTDNPLYYAGSLYLNSEKVTELTIPESVTSIGKWAFYGCAGLTSVTIPDSVTSIGESAFNECSSLTSVTIGNSVTSIGWRAFYDCTGLTSVTIPDSVTSIDDQAFSGTAYYSNKANWQDGVLYIGNHLIAAKENIIGDYTVKSGTKTIADYAFSECSSLTSVTIPDSVTGIGSGAFSECSSLTSVTIPDSVTNIGLLTFYGCTCLTSVTIPSNVTSIGNYAFEDCSSLTSITIPHSVTNIGEMAFAWCGSLTVIMVDTENPVYHSAGNCLIETASKTLILGCQSSVIPSGGSVTNIGEQAFAGCGSLTSVTIPLDVTSIGFWAFNGCRNLTDIYYLGTQDEWDAIEKENAEISETVTVHCFCIVSNDVIAHYADRHAFDEGVTLSAAVRDNVVLPADLAECENAVVLDITLQKEEEAVQPDSAVTVRVPVPQGMDAAICRVFRMEADGSVTDMQAKAVGGYLYFTTEHFSLYVIAEKALAATLGDVDGDTEITSTDARLVLQYYAKKIDETKLNIAVADVDGDTEITSTDARLILQYYAKKITEFPTKK